MADFLKDQEGRAAILAATRYAGLKLPQKPRLAPWLVAVELGDSRLQLRSAESANTLTHPLLIEIFRRIETIMDGRHTLDQIVSAAGSDFLPSTVVFLLKLLQGNGLLQPGFGETTIEEEEQVRWDRQLRFLGHFVSDAVSAQSVLARARVGVAGSGELRQALLSAITSVGVGIVSEFSESSTLYSEPRETAGFDLIVAVEESHAFWFFDTLNRACLVSGTRWLRVSTTGTSAQLGPTIVPHQTACYTCLDLRTQTHESERDGYLGYRARVATLEGRADEGGIAPLWSVVAGQAALEVVRLLTGFSSPVTVGRFYEFSAVSPLALSHEVLKVPQCPSCGGRRTFIEAWDQSMMPMDVET